MDEATRESDNGSGKQRSEAMVKKGGECKSFRGSKDRARVGKKHHILTENENKSDISNRKKEPPSESDKRKRRSEWLLADTAHRQPMSIGKKKDSQQKNCLSGCNAENT